MKVDSSEFDILSKTVEHSDIPLTYAVGSESDIHGNRASPFDDSDDNIP